MGVAPHFRQPLKQTPLRAGFPFYYTPVVLKVCHVADTKLAFNNVTRRSYASMGSSSLSLRGKVEVQVRMGRPQILMNPTAAE